MNKCSYVQKLSMNKNLHTIEDDLFSELEAVLHSAENVLRAADTFKALSDTTRLRIVLALRVQELCVHDLAEIIRTSESNTSHQLRLLRSLKIVKFRKEGKQVFYSIDDSHISNMVDEMMEHIREE